jgi:polyvinyl alcohol dehydrogenase (cytochrome)
MDRLRRALLGGACVVVGAAAFGSVPARAAGATGHHTAIGPMDWPTYQHDIHRTGRGSTTLDQTSVRTLAQAWFFPTKDAVTAEPIVVGGTVYVGSWDGNFYALDAATGKQRWVRTLKVQLGVKPAQPGTGVRQPADITTDGGLVTATAWFEPGKGHRPDLVIFGGGYTLYALNAADGSVYWEHDYTGRPELPPNPNNDPTRIFSSPAVVGDHVLFSADTDGSNGWRGYMVSADLNTGKPQWIRELDVDTSGKVLNNGCGGVWGSPSIDLVHGWEVVGVADCNNQAIAPYSERTIAVRIADGTIAWVFTPPRLQHGDPACDFDTGTTPMTPVDSRGRQTFIGVGGKDGTYYSLDPATGHLRWDHNVVFGGTAGGFLGSDAYDGTRIYGATALGDFGNTDPQHLVCEPGNPSDLPVQEPSLYAFDPATGAVLWSATGSQAFGSTTSAGGMVFVDTMLGQQIDVRDGATGQLLSVIPEAGSDSGVVEVGNAIFFGTGTTEYAGPVGVGVYAYTPLGAAPVAGAAGSEPVGGVVVAADGVLAGAGSVSGGVAAASLGNLPTTLAAGTAAGPVPVIALLVACATLRRRRRSRAIAGVA